MVASRSPKPLTGVRIPLLLPTKIRTMNREEIMNFLRENLTIEIWLDKNYEGENEYVTAKTILKLAGEEISNDYDSTNLN